MGSCGPGLYSISHCIGSSLVVFFEACVIGFQHISWMLLPIISGLVCDHVYLTGEAVVVEFL